MNFKYSISLLALVFSTASSAEFWVWLDQNHTFHSSFDEKAQRPVEAIEINALSVEEEGTTALILDKFEGRDIMEIFTDLNNGGARSFVFLSIENRELLISKFKSLLLFRVGTMQKDLEQLDQGIAGVQIDSQRLLHEVAKQQADLMDSAGQLQKVEENLLEIDQEMKKTLEDHRREADEAFARCERELKESFAKRDQKIQELAEKYCRN